MPNILLTNFCNQKCPYCFAENEFKKKKTEMSFDNFKLVLDFLKKSSDKNVRLMGGEPTLHSGFKEIIDFALAGGFSVQVFTNGLFSSDILNFLSEKAGKIKYSFNLNSPRDYSKSQWKLILNNLETLSRYNNCLIGKVIWRKNFNIDYLLRLTSKYPIKTVMLRIANPIIGEKNRFPAQKDYPALAKNIIREIKKTDKDKVKIGFGCGLYQKMFNKRQQDILKKHNIDLKWGCQANSGRFDIRTDLSVFRCFPLSDWQKKNLLDFKNIKEVEEYFSRLMKDRQLLNSKNDFINQGPCFSYLLINNL